MYRSSRKLYPFAHGVLVCMVVRWAAVTGIHSIGSLAVRSVSPHGADSEGVRAVVVGGQG